VYTVESCRDRSFTWINWAVTYNDATLEHLRKAHLDGISTDADFSISISVGHDDDDDVLLSLLQTQCDGKCKS
jgi:hypothetical protein